MTRSDAGRIHVLHVDDDPGMRQITADVLGREADFEVTTAPNADEGLALLGELAIDCVVSDYDMPGKNGLEFLDAVRERHPDLPFVLFTGERGLASDALVRGVTDFLQKGSGADQYALLRNRIENAVELYRASRRLDDRRDRREAVTAGSHDVCTILDPEGTVEFVGSSVERILGYGTDRLVGDDFTDHVHPDDRHRLRERLDGTAASTPGDRGDGAPETDWLEYRIRRADGDWCRVESTWTDRTDDPSVEGVVVHARPVENGTRRSGTVGRYEPLLETLPVGVAALDEEARIEWVNEAFWTAIDKTEDEVTGTQFLEIVEEGLVGPGIVDDYLDAVRSLLSAECDDDRATFEFEVDPPHVEGHREYEAYVGLRALDDGEFAGTINAFLDVTERKRRERELEQYERAMETVPDGVFLLDEDGVMTRVNDAWAAIVGSDPSELHGEPITKLVDDGVLDREFVETYMDLIPRLLSAGTDRGKFTARVTRPDDDGRGRVYEVNVGLLPHEDGFRGTAGVVRDVTEKRKRKRELERENERLEQFSSVVSHDLRNPLNVVQASIALVEETGDLDRLEDARAAADRMGELVDDLLTLARQGDRVEQLGSVDLGRLADGCWENVEANGARLRVDADCTVRADASRLKQLLENLFRNAVQHGGEDVSVEVGGLDGGTGFYVEDDGPGIPEAERDEVFESGYSTSHDGTGFGLAIVKEIAEAHDWTVEVTEGDAGGARFEVRDVTSP